MKTIRAFTIGPRPWGFTRVEYLRYRYGCLHVPFAWRRAIARVRRRCWICGQPAPGHKMDCRV